MRFAFIDAEKAVWPVEVQCDVLEVSRSGYYAWRARPASARARKDAEVVADIKAAHKAGRGTYGSPRVHRELRAKGCRIGKKRVERLMRQEGIVARKKRRFRKTTDSNHLHPIAPNVLERNFEVELPNAAWVTDVTYVYTHEGWLYLAAILDLFSRRVIGWSASANNDRALAISALDRAVQARKPNAGLIHHSDRGSVYASTDYGAALTQLGARKSMSRKGDCWDNAVAESFFATLKRELLNRARWTDSVDVRYAVFEYIETFYNRRRLHSTLGYKTPVQFETEYAAACELAA